MDLALWEYAALILAGIVAGFINVMAGGGSIITVPIMMFLGVPGPVANGTNRLPIVAQNISACLTYLRHGVPELRLVLSLAVCAIPGAIVGALLGVTISAEAFNIVLAGVMAVGNGVGGWLGARLTLSGGEPVIRALLMIAIAVMIVKLIWFT